MHIKIFYQAQFATFIRKETKQNTTKNMVLQNKTIIIK